MTIEYSVLPDPTITCQNCQACCCRLEVRLLTDTGVPQYFITENAHHVEVMKRHADGWCAALDRNTLMCTIYAYRPLVCREFEMGSYECKIERAEVLGITD
ncbi:MAG: YkgJ family cysteine cluster protein [Paraglaciecola sp.]|uniref:YkgJ family cysteine cluster protein n=1 Tax=Pseudomonadati TaxID=3379134 RepID=UPI00273EAED7|nr:YkgJ family cysteine cluster protein [Paraglaciecola sp.]MDP5032465.1 YkgJ family cysteine cluster protein [Paraglaciecola sp.]MDP5130629.1 YkgJ family cysteine cluster protein [Paraglaciecola sp.]